jgi:hypothetical protein
MLSRFPDRRVRRHCIGALFRRHRFAGEGRLFGPQILRFDEPQVCGNLVTRFQQHDIPRNKLLGGDHAGLAAAHRPRLGGQHVADGIQ